MKRILLLSLVWLSIFAICTMSASAQENEKNIINRNLKVQATAKSETVNARPIADLAISIVPTVKSAATEPQNKGIIALGSSRFEPSISKDSIASTLQQCAAPRMGFAKNASDGNNNNNKGQLLLLDTTRVKGIISNSCNRKDKSFIKDTVCKVSEIKRNLTPDKTIQSVTTSTSITASEIGDKLFPSEQQVNTDNYNFNPQNTLLAGSNLTPYQPSGWDDKIVLSTVTGTNTSATTIYDNQTIYLDWAATNDGLSNITQAFSTKLYVDGALYATYSSTELPSNYYTYMLDVAIGPLSAGPHTFKLILDANGDVSETDESDNEYTCTKTIVLNGSANVNLTPFQPYGWDDKIMLSTETGTNTSSTTIYDNQTIYLDWAVANLGISDITKEFATLLYIDGVLQDVYSPEGLNSNYYLSRIDVSISPLSAGLHTFKLVVDAYGEIDETNENDNEYTFTKTIISSGSVNLTPYQPSGWDDKIVLSTVTGTNTSATTIYDNQTIYLDWAATNDGFSNITQAFSIKLYVDGAWYGTYSSTELPSKYYANMEDLTFGQLPAGPHTFKLIVDANGDVPETNENDNEYTCTKTIISSGSENLTPYQPSGWDDKIVLSTVTGTNISATAIYDNQTIYLDWAATNDGLSNITQAFSTKLYVDGALYATYSSTELPSKYYTYMADVAIGPLPAGPHTFKLIVDANGDVSEMDESDNEYACTKTIIARVLHRITATAGEHGIISPGGSVEVVSGNNQAFEVTANIGCHISELNVDGNSVADALNASFYTFTFSNVTGDHTIEANFAPNSYLVAYYVDYVMQSTATVSYGAKATEPTLTKDGYHLDGWYNGTTKYDFNTPVTCNISLTAKWVINTYTITGTVTGTDGVTVALNGDVSDSKTVNSGGTYSFTVSYGQNVEVTATKIGYQFAPVKYSLTSIDADKAGNDFVATNTTSVENDFATDISCYPNPVKNRLVIKLPSSYDIASIQICSITGKILYWVKNTTEKDFSIDVTDYRSGVLLVKITNNKGQSTIRKIIKQ